MTSFYFGPFGSLCTIDFYRKNPMPIWIQNNLTETTKNNIMLGFKPIEVCESFKLDMKANGTSEFWSGKITASMYYGCVRSAFTALSYHAGDISCRRICKLPLSIDLT